MTQNQLHEFFRGKKQKAGPDGIDWVTRRDAWIRAVKELYQTVTDDYLKAAKADVEIDYPDKVVTESSIGVYHISELSLRVGDEVVLFSPKGTNIVGAKGRIDVFGDRGEATIVWLGDRWSVIASRAPMLRLIDLNAESFSEILKDIMRP
jgi:molybdopterin-binding protein